LNNEELINDKLFVTAATRANELFSYGDLIPMGWLKEQFGIQEPAFAQKSVYTKIQFEFMSNMDGFREIMLEDFKKHLANVTGKGYLIVHAKDQTPAAMEKLKRSVSQEMHRAVYILNNIQEDLLTSDQIKSRDESLGKIAAVTSFSKKRLSAF